MRVALLGVVLLVGCGSSSSSSSSSGGDFSECFFDGTLSGGLQGSINVNGCGSSGTAVIAVTELGNGHNLAVRFRFVTPLKGGEIGPQPLSAMEIYEKKDNVESNWKGTACSVELTKSEKSPTEVFKNRYLLEGKGSCSQPLGSVAPTSRESITISPFKFGAFIDPLE